MHKKSEEEFVSKIEKLNSYVTSETEISLLFIITVSLFLLSLKRTRFNQCFAHWMQSEGKDGIVITLKGLKLCLLQSTLL